MIIETAGLALATFFATIGPLDVAAVFAALTANQTPQQRRSLAMRGSLISAAILVAFALVGEPILKTLGITLPALRTAGGILLLLMGIELVFARSSGANSTTAEEEREAAGKADIAVFPLATPLIAGPGAMGAAILLMANQQGDFVGQAIVLASLLAILLLTFVSLLLAGRINALLGVTGMHVIMRVMGVILCALAVQFIFDGIRNSGLIPM
ncbi:MAG: MarC family protein [Rhodoferax sp.]|nr:MarC family protein [Rhodoferax sp.]MCB2043113.1 MarC family protein [Rhodoferax sp.]MCW5629990.1 MarC family protein [Rhodoferax sp.]